MKDGSKDLRRGHRERVRKRFIKDGNLDSFQDYEVLELLLFYAYPMKDTKSIAKKLLEQYHSLHNIFNSKPEELMLNGGLTENVAVYLSMMPYVARKYLSSYYGKGTLINTVTKLNKLLESLLLGQNYESMYLITLDAGKKLIAADRMYDGVSDEVTLSIEGILERAVLRKAKFVILAHNHPSGSSSPSEADDGVTKNLKAKLEALGIRMLDHVIICGKVNYSYAQHGRFFHLNGGM